MSVFLTQLALGIILVGFTLMTVALLRDGKVKKRTGLIGGWVFMIGLFFILFLVFIQAILNITL
jgi:hypothetical protein